MVKVTVSASGIGDVFLSRLPVASRRLQQAVISSCEPFVPYRTGELCRSVTAEGEGPSGRIVYTAPHASLCYYADRPFSGKVHPQACAHWFEAAKAVELGAWTRAVTAALTDRRPERGG